MKNIIKELNNVLQFKCSQDKNKIDIIFRYEEYNQVVKILVKHKKILRITDIESCLIKYKMKIEIVEV